GLVLVVFIVAIVAGCAHAPPARPLACVGAPRPATDSLEHSALGMVRGSTVSTVTIAGVDPALRATLGRLLTIQSGDKLDQQRVADSVRRLWALGMFSDLRVEVASDHFGVELTFVVTPQPAIDHVYVMGSGADRPEVRRLRWLVGAPYDPERI